MADPIKRRGMSKLEELSVGDRFIRNLTNLNDNILSNATEYKTRVDEIGVIEMAQVINEDADLYIKRINYHRSLKTRVASLEMAVLANLGISLQDYLDVLQDFEDIANAQKNARKTTKAEIIAVSDVVLGALAPIENLWG